MRRRGGSCEPFCGFREAGEERIFPFEFFRELFGGERGEPRKDIPHDEKRDKECDGAVERGSSLCARLGREQEEQGHRHGREKIRREAVQGREFFDRVKEGERRRRPSESRGYERGEQLRSHRCGHLKMRFITEEGFAPVE